MMAQTVTDLNPGRVTALVLSATAHPFSHPGPEGHANFFKTRVALLADGGSIAKYAPALFKTMMGPGAARPEIDHAL